jgi:hypothetical protein
MLLSLITPSHDPKWLVALWQSIRVAAGDVPFEWIVVLNGTCHSMDLGIDDPRVRVARLPGKIPSVGLIKQISFALGKGDVLIEMDHDDLLMPGALPKIAAAFEDPAVDFVYSHCADFSDDGQKRTYHDPAVRAGWESEGWRFSEIETPLGRLAYPISWAPSAASFSTIHWAPNHVRAWRREFYQRVGGHDVTLDVCDDLDLLQRTYIAGTCKLIPEVLYLYRTHGGNTWAKNQQRVAHLSGQLYLKHYEKLVLRQTQLQGLPAYDLGGAHDSPEGWIPVDIDAEGLGGRGLVTDLNGPWPWNSNSVGAFRAADFLEHLPDGYRTMRNIHRCLVEGGWLISTTPSTDGRGAFQDPTHLSFWNSNSMLYYTRAEQAKYIKNKTTRFIDIRTEDWTPPGWCEERKIPYVAADLVAIKGGPGEVEIPGARCFPLEKP